MGFKVLRTSSLSMPEPNWIHSRHAKEAAARCSSPLPDNKRNGFKDPSLIKYHTAPIKLDLNTTLGSYLKTNLSDFKLNNKIILNTFLEAAFDAVCDGHPSLRDKLVQDPCGHCRLKPIQCSLSGLSTEETGAQTLTITQIKSPSHSFKPIVRRKVAILEG